jgi:predicted RNA-binding protein with PIN domain
MGKKKELLTIICHTCGKVFKVYPWRAFSARYCSRECRKAAVKLAMRKYHKKVDHFIEKTCMNEFCEKKFIVTPRNMNQKFCCRECRRYASSLKYRHKIEEQEKRMINKIWRF